MMCSLVNGNYRGKKLKLEAEKLLELRAARDRDPASPFRGKGRVAALFVLEWSVYYIFLLS